MWTEIEDAVVSALVMHKELAESDVPLNDAKLDTVVDGFDVCHYPFEKPRSFQEDGHVLNNVRVQAERYMNALNKAFEDAYVLVACEENKKTVFAEWTGGLASAHPLLDRIDEMDENDDLLVGYIRQQGPSAMVYRGLTKSQCPLLTAGMRLLLKNRGNPRIELAFSASDEPALGLALMDITPKLLANSYGVNNIVHKFDTGLGLGLPKSNLTCAECRWGHYLLTRDVIKSIATLDKYLAFPHKGMPEPWWYRHQIYNELNLLDSREGPDPKGDVGPWNAVWFAHVVSMDNHYGTAFKDAFLQYVRVHRAMFWRYKVQVQGATRNVPNCKPVVKRPMFVVMDH